MSWYSWSSTVMPALFSSCCRCCCRWCLMDLHNCHAPSLVIRRYSHSMVEYPLVFSKTASPTPSPTFSRCNSLGRLKTGFAVELFRIFLCHFDWNHTFCSFTSHKLKKTWKSQYSRNNFLLQQRLPEFASLKNGNCFIYHALFYSRVKWGTWEKGVIIGCILVFSDAWPDELDEPDV